MLQKEGDVGDIALLTNQSGRSADSGNVFFGFIDSVVLSLSPAPGWSFLTAENK